MRDNSRNCTTARSVYCRCCGAEPLTTFQTLMSSVHGVLEENLDREPRGRKTCYIIPDLRFAILSFFQVGWPKKQAVLAEPPFCQSKNCSFISEDYCHAWDSFVGYPNCCSKIPWSISSSFVSAKFPSLFSYHTHISAAAPDGCYNREVDRV